ncbi:MAG TPA: hypothetical protein VFQ83_08895 [Candidatus Udaeobacter sp.]|nr:hypothetical protein [Candidatus Udaeobacter sp.]
MDDDQLGKEKALMCNARIGARMKDIKSALIKAVAVSEFTRRRERRGVQAVLHTPARRHPPRRRGFAVATRHRFHWITCGVCVLFAIPIQGLCDGDVTKLKLPAEDRKVLQDSSRFHEVHSTRDLPTAVIALCAEDGKIANPGQNWNATDAVTDPTLPWKRLIWAGVGGDYYVVHHERGGIAHSFHVLLPKWRRITRSQR